MPVATRVIDAAAEIAYDDTATALGAATVQAAIAAIAGGGGAGGSYTNAAPVPQSLGGIPAGTTFNAVPLSAVLTELIYPYQAPAFASFAIAGQPTTVEVGTTIAGTVTFAWTTANPANVAAGSLAILDVTAGTTLAGGLVDDGSQDVAVGTVTGTAAGSHTWRLTGTDSRGDPFARDFTVTWLWKVYAGTSGAPTLNAAGIAGLATGGLAADFRGTYAFAAGGYKYLAWPDSLGGPADIKDAATGLRVAMADATADPAYSHTQGSFRYALVSVTNAVGVATQYRVYRTYNTLGGSIQLVVS